MDGLGVRHMGVLEQLKQPERVGVSRVARLRCKSIRPLEKFELPLLLDAIELI